MRPSPATYSPPPDTGLVIVHRDEHLLVLDKPPGLLSVPGKGPDLADCLEARVKARYPQALKSTGWTGIPRGWWSWP